VLAFAVARRSRELAIRMAVGASRRNVVVMVAGLTARLVGLGLLCGGAMMYWLKRLAQGQGGPLDSDSTWIFLAPAAIVVVIGVLATMVPSRRAMAVDPAVLLRSE
jgi:putative ABC transport system permease protein